MATTGTSVQSVSDVEYGPLGQTTQADPTTIWLMAGNGAEQAIHLAAGESRDRTGPSQRILQRRSAARRDASSVDR